MKVLVIGGSGMLGRDLVAELARRRWDVAAPTSSEIDLTNPESVAKVAAMREVDWCVNCAAYTAVDLAESEPERAFELNSLGPGYLARSCAIAGINLIHISTDFVFDGASESAYVEEDAVGPLGVYGRTKLEGEEAVRGALPIAIILRTSWLYGPEGKSFPRTMIAAWKAGKSLRVVADQVGCPTYTGDLARVIADAIQADLFPGVYHACGPEATTWHRFAEMAIEAYRHSRGLDQEIEIEPIASTDWSTPAARPKFSAMSTAKLQAAGILPMRPVADALAEFVERLED